MRVCVILSYLCSLLAFFRRLASPPLTLAPSTPRLNARRTCSCHPVHKDSCFNYFNVIDGTDNNYFKPKTVKNNKLLRICVNLIYVVTIIDLLY
jgi:hypothetical protein